MKKYGFPSSHKLKLKKDFENVFKQNQSYNSANLILYISRGETGISRIGIITSRRVGKAIQRNRWRRLIREIFRLNQSHLKKPVDMIFIVKANRPLPEYRNLEKEIFSLWEKGNLI